VLEPKPERVNSSYAREMLTRAVLIPERTPEGIEDRQRMIRALHDKTRRLRLEDFFSNARLENKTHHVDESFLDTFGTMADSRHAAIGEAEYAAARNYARLVRELSLDPGTHPVYAFLREKCGDGLFKLNELVAAREMIFRLTDGVTSGRVEWRNVPEKTIAISRVPESEDERIELDELRHSFIHTMLKSYGSKYQPDALFVLRNLGMLEALVHYVGFTAADARPWCLPEMVESREPFLELHG
jgi:hypothetical protein